MEHFKLVSKYQPTGDQPQAIEALVKGFQEGNQFQTCLLYTSVSSLVAIVVVRKFAPKFPMAVVVMAAGVFLTCVLSLLHI